MFPILSNISIQAGLNKTRIQLTSIQNAKVLWVRPMPRVSLWWVSSTRADKSLVLVFVIIAVFYSVVLVCQQQKEFKLRHHPGPWSSQYSRTLLITPAVSKALPHILAALTHLQEETIMLQSGIKVTHRNSALNQGHIKPWWSSILDVTDDFFG